MSEPCGKHLGDGVGRCVREKGHDGQCEDFANIAARMDAAGADHPDGISVAQGGHVDVTVSPACGCEACQRTYELAGAMIVHGVRALGEGLTPGQLAMAVALVMAVVGMEGQLPADEMHARLEAAMRVVAKEVVEQVPGGPERTSH